MCPCVSLSLCVSLPLCLSVSLSLCLSVSLSLCLSVSLYRFLVVSLSLCVYLPLCISVPSFYIRRRWRWLLAGWIIPYLSCCLVSLFPRPERNIETKRNFHDETHWIKAATHNLVWKVDTLYNYLRTTNSKHYFCHLIH
jgi:hypothetical protein